MLVYIVCYRIFKDATGLTIDDCGSNYSMSRTEINSKEINVRICLPRLRLIH